MARQFEVYTTDWQHGNLIVGWDPAIGTYYGQILDSKVDELGPLLWLTPMGDEKNIQTVEDLEKYINYKIKKRWNDDSNWPPIKLNKLLRINLERDRSAEGGYWNEIPADTNLNPLQPPSVSSSGIGFTYNPKDSIEDSIENLKDWFFDNYEDPAQHTSYNSRKGGYLYIHGGPYSAQEELFKYWGDEYPEKIINATSEAIEAETGISEWAPAYWRIEEEEDYDRESQFQDQYSAVLEGLSELESLLNEIKPPIGIGHNQPPKEMEELLSAIDFFYIQNLNVEIKKHGDNPSTVSTNVSDSPSKLRHIKKGLLAILVACTLGGSGKVGSQIVDHYDVGNKICTIIDRLANDIEKWLEPSLALPLPVGDIETI